jgi:hypothetical protein
VRNPLGVNQKKRPITDEYFRVSQEPMPDNLTLGLIEAATPNFSSQAIRGRVRLRSTLATKPR